MGHVIEIDEGACCAHGDCEEIAPEVFRVDGIVRIIGDGPTELVVRVAEECPLGAISVFDLETGEQLA
jgi:ferredoxin